MIKHTILNFALLKDGDVYSKLQHCTTFADESIEIIQFETKQERDTFMIENGIVIEDAEEIE
jgi:hypothetical protein